MVVHAKVVLETTGRPEYPSAAQWSQDNLLAVAAGPGVLVVAPPGLNGARGSTALPQPECSFMEVDAYPEETIESPSYTSTYLLTRGMYQARNSQMASSKIGIRSISWSPLGCDQAGNALLSSVTDNFQVQSLCIIHVCPQLRWHQMPCHDFCRYACMLLPLTAQCSGQLCWS